MKIEVQLFASLMQYMPGQTPYMMEVAEGTTVGAVLVNLKVPVGLAKLIFRNGVHAREEDVLREGDRVAAFPPIAGG
ncbi:MAG: MoaD/ThiS family protein [Desulfobacteraceae bacterium]|nr:MAG: MoaD/ThiS family protein [Desulfobacteraceae bacterium]